MYVHVHIHIHIHIHIRLEMSICNTTSRSSWMCCGPQLEVDRILGPTCDRTSGHNIQPSSHRLPFS